MTSIYTKPEAHDVKMKAVNAIYELRAMFDSLTEEERVYLAGAISDEAHAMKVQARAMHSEAKGAFYSEEEYRRLRFKDEPI